MADLYLNFKKRTKQFHITLRILSVLESREDVGVAGPCGSGMDKILLNEAAEQFELWVFDCLSPP
jgi:hypothetical protein